MQRHAGAESQVEAKRRVGTLPEEIIEPRRQQAQQSPMPPPWRR